MTENRRQSFIDFISANPDDDEARLVFSDWLEEQGEIERAELIRVQIERACLPEWDARQIPLKLRERELLGEHEAAWRAGLPEIEGVKWGAFRRGFVAQATFASFELLGSVTRECWGATPVESVRVRWPRKHDFVNYLEPISGLRELTIESRAVNHDEARSLADAPLLSTLRSLEVRNCALGFEGFAWLIASPHLGNLACLRSGANAIGNGGIQAIQLAPSLGSLEVLELSESGEYGRYNEDPVITSEGLETLAGWSGLSRIRSLILTGNQIWPGGLRALFRSPYAKNLKNLVLRDSDLSAATLEDFHESHPDFGLETLDLSENFLESGGISSLTQAGCLSGLKKLTLDRCELFYGSAEDLSQASFYRTLQMLNVDHNYFETRALQALFGHEPLELHTLSIRSNSLAREGLLHLVESPGSNSLLELDLRSNLISEEVIDAFVSTRQLKNLLILRLGDYRMVSSAAEKLEASELAKRLAILEMDHSPNGGRDIPF